MRAKTEFLLDATPAAFRYSQADAFTPPTALYGPTGADITSSTGAPTVGSLYAFPFLASLGGAIDQIGFNITGAGAVGSVARCGLYAPAPGDLVPGKLLFDAGEQDGTIVGAKLTAIAPPIVLYPGLVYWLAFICGTAAPTVTTFTSGWHMFGRNAAFNAQFGWQKTGFGYGALPADFPVGPPQPGICSSNAALVALRFARYSRPVRVRAS